MNLFSKDKELINKILNGILLLWLLGSIIFFVSSVYDVLVKEPRVDRTYEEFKITYKDMLGGMEEADADAYVEEMYKDSNLSLEYEEYNNKRELFMSFMNLAAVSVAIVLLNRKKSA